MTVTIEDRLVAIEDRKAILFHIAPLAEGWARRP